MTYNPSFYAEDSEWLEWIAAAYEQQQAQEDAEDSAESYATAQATGRGDSWERAASLNQYADTAYLLAGSIEDETEIILLEAEQAETEWEF